MVCHRICGQIETSNNAIQNQLLYSIRNPSHCILGNCFKIAAFLKRILILFLIIQISFLIPPDIVPGRMALLITLLLCLINILINVMSNAPKSDIVTPISVWLMTCIMFIIYALLQYGCILLWKYMSLPSCPSEKAVRKIDLTSLALATIVFFSFNVFFWCVYVY